VQEGEFNRRLRRSASFISSASALIVALALMAVADGGGGRLSTRPVLGPVHPPQVTPFEPPQLPPDTSTATQPPRRQPAMQQPPVQQPVVRTPATVLAGAVRLVSMKPAPTGTLPPTAPPPSPSTAPVAAPRPLPVAPPAKAMPTPTQCADRNGEKADKSKEKKEKAVSLGRRARAVPPARGRKVVRPSRSSGRHPHRDTRATCRSRWDL
jgi:hypothetical protein